jgi:hypothetical protein
MKISSIPSNKHSKPPLASSGIIIILDEFAYEARVCVEQVCNTMTRRERNNNDLRNPRVDSVEHF